MRELESENAKLKRLLAEKALESGAMGETLSNKPTASWRRDASIAPIA